MVDAQGDKEVSVASFIWRGKGRVSVSSLWALIVNFFKLFKYSLSDAERGVGLRADSKEAYFFPHPSSDREPGESSSDDASLTFDCICNELLLVAIVN